MNNFKHGVAIVCCGVSLSFLPANSQAGIPIFELIENPVPLAAELIDTFKSLSEAKQQWALMAETVRAISAGAVGPFGMGASLGDENEEVCMAANSVAQTIKSAYNTNVQAQDTLEEVNGIVDGAQRNIADSLVQDVESTMKLAFNMPQNSILLAQNDVTISIEEEEEESTDNSVTQDKMITLFTNMKKISKQFNIELNDAFDSALNIINQNNETNHKSLTALNKMLKSAKEADAVKLAEIRTRLTDLIEREQSVADKNVQAIENNRNQYNREYQENIADGISNYQKVVLAYINGDSSKEDVLDAGAKLKQVMANSRSATNVSDNYKKEIAEIQKETLALTEDVKALYNKEEIDS